MPTPIIANANSVEVRGQLFGQLVENVWHVGSTGPLDESAMLDVMSIFQLAYSNLMTPLSQDYTVNEIFMKYLGNAAGPEATLSITPAQTGGAATASMPGGTAFCISLRTALAGRRFRGRKYIAGLPVSSVVANALNVTLADQLVTAVQALIGDLSSNGTPLSIVSFTGLTVTQVSTSLYTDLFVDSQRRRLTNRGA